MVRDLLFIHRHFRSAPGGAFSITRGPRGNLMVEKRLRVGLLGGAEGDLYVLAELHKRPEVEIAFVYDRNPSAVGVEIAEILRIPALRKPEDIAAHLPVDVVVVEDRVTFAREISTRGGAQSLTRAEALERFAPRPAPRPATPAAAPVQPLTGHPLEDALAGFERLFDRTRLLKLLLDLAVEETGASNGSIMMYSHEAGELYIAHATGLSARSTASCWP